MINGTLAGSLGGIRHWSKKLDGQLSFEMFGRNDIRAGGAWCPNLVGEIRVESREDIPNCRHRSANGYNSKLHGEIDERCQSTHNSNFGIRFRGHVLGVGEVHWT